MSLLDLLFVMSKRENIGITTHTKTTLLCTIQGKVEKFDIVEQCAQELQNTKWRLKLITNVNFFALLNFRNVNFRNFEELSIDDLPLVEGIVERNIFHYDFDIQEGEYVGE